MADGQKAMKAEIKALKQERTALLVNEQNLREELAALKASLGEPVAWMSEDGAIEESHKLWMDEEQNPAWHPVYALTNKDQP